MKKFNFILLVSALLTNACSELSIENDPDTLCNPDIESCDSNDDNNSNDSFITIWTTTYSNQKIQFPVQENAGNLTIDWGDGTMTENISTSAKFVSHTYSTAKTYTITVRGNINAWSCSKDDSCRSTCCAQLAGIQSYGNTWFDQYAFCRAKNLTNLPASDTPQFKNNDMKGAFYGASQFNQDICYWDTSNVTDMSYMFYKATAFNQPLNNWDTSKVTDMSWMFCGAQKFNQPLNDWDTSNVTNMRYMFAVAYEFNQPLNDWDTSKVTHMDGMFNNATAFNQPLNDWNVSNVIYMSQMFYDSGLDQTNYCALMSSPYSSKWKKYNLGKSYTCP